MFDFPIAAVLARDATSRKVHDPRPAGRKRVAARLVRKPARPDHAA